MDIQKALEESYNEALFIEGGRTASYIPELAKVSSELFAVSICDIEQNLFNMGDANYHFTLQSISKVLAYALVLENYSEEEIDVKVGIEPTGEVFDSIIKLDKYQRPFNPMVNAGAIAVTDLLISKYKKDALNQSLKYFSSLLGKESVSVNQSVFQSEMDTGDRNRSLAYLLKSLEILDNPVDQVLELYFKHCSIEATTADLAKMGATFARRGKTMAGDSLITKPNLRKLLSVMLSCGMYNYAGQWIYEIGLPAKSGVSGGILSVDIDNYGIAVFSPRINADGCSNRGASVTKSLCESSACISSIFRFQP